MNCKDLALRCKADVRRFDVKDSTPWLSCSCEVMG